MKKFKRILSTMLIAVMCMSMSTGVLTAGAVNYSYGSSDGSVTYGKSPGGAIAGSNYSLTWNSDDFVVGKSMSYSAYYNSSKGLKMSVSDSKIASLTTKTSKDGKTVSGKMTFKKKGTVTLKLVNKKTGKTVASKKFTVKPYINALKFSSSSKSCTKGKSYTLNYTVTKYNGKKDTSSAFPSYVSVSASSSNSKVVQVTSTSKGKVKIKALKKGTATIKIKANDGSGKTSTMKITVK